MVDRTVYIRVIPRLDTTELYRYGTVIHNETSDATPKGEMDGIVLVE